jgi:hypothetical protein
MAAAVGDEPFELTASRSKLMRSLLLGLVVFGGLSAANLLLGNTVAGAVSAVMGVALLVVGLAGLAQGRRVLVTIGPDGVTPGKGALLPWSDLEALRLTRMRPRLFLVTSRMKLLVFVPRDPERAIAPLTGMWKRTARMTSHLYGGSLVIQRSVIDESFDDIITAVHRFAPVPVRDDT